MSSASDCRWVNPGARDSAATAGRRACLAGEVLQDAVQGSGAVEPGRDGDPAGDRGGPEPRTSRIRRMYGSRCGRQAASGVQAAAAAGQ